MSRLPAVLGLQKWELHHNIAYVKLHGEAGSADVRHADKWINIGIPRILRRLRGKRHTQCR